MPFQAARKGLDFRPAYRVCVLPAFCLDINDIEPQLVFLDDAVHAAIPTSSKCLASVLSRTSVPHCDQKIYNKSLKERCGSFANLLHEIVGKRSPDRLVCGGEKLLGCLAVFSMDRRRNPIRLRSALTKFAEFGILLKHRIA